MAILTPKRWHSDWADVSDARPTTPAQVHVTDPAPDRVLYGPDGAVLLTVTDRQPFGFNRG